MSLTLPPNLVVLSELPSGHDGFDIRDEALMATLSAAEDAHYWHVARNELIAARLRSLGVKPGDSFLDIGCGGGAVSAHLSRGGLRVTGVDGHLPRVLEAARRAPDAMFYVHDLSQETTALPSGFAAAGLFDVLEHLDDPTGAVESALARVVPGGLVVGTVPALMGLWSDYDAQSGHKLRYDQRSLRRVLGAARGADIVEVSWFNHLLVPFMWLLRRGRATAEPGMSVPAAPVNLAFLSWLRAEYWADGRLGALRTRLPGASLFFAVRRSPAS